MTLTAVPKINEPQTAIKVLKTTAMVKKEELPPPAGGASPPSRSLIDIGPSSFLTSPSRREAVMSPPFELSLPIILFC